MVIINPQLIIHLQIISSILVFKVEQIKLIIYNNSSTIFYSLRIFFNENNYRN